MVQLDPVHEVEVFEVPLHVLRHVTLHVLRHVLSHPPLQSSIQVDSHPSHPPHDVKALMTTVGAATNAPSIGRTSFAVFLKNRLRFIISLLSILIQTKLKPC